MFSHIGKGFDFSNKLPVSYVTFTRIIMATAAAIQILLKFISSDIKNKKTIPPEENGSKYFQLNPHLPLQPANNRCCGNNGNMDNCSIHNQWNKSSKVFIQTGTMLRLYSKHYLNVNLSFLNFHCQYFIIEAGYNKINTGSDLSSVVGFSIPLVACNLFIHIDRTNALPHNIVDFDLQKFGFIGKTNFNIGYKRIWESLNLVGNSRSFDAYRSMVIFNFIDTIFTKIDRIFDTKKCGVSTQYPIFDTLRNNLVDNLRVLSFIFELHDVETIPYCFDG